MWRQDMDLRMRGIVNGTSRHEYCHTYQRRSSKVASATALLLATMAHVASVGLPLGVATAIAGRCCARTRGEHPLSWAFGCWGQVFQHAKDGCRDFCTQPMEHAGKHAMDVLKLVWPCAASVGLPLGRCEAWMAMMDLKRLDRKAWECLLAYPWEPVIHG